MREKSENEDVSGSSNGLSEFEKEVYEYINKRREVITSNLPLRMMGAVPRLKRLGLVEIYKRSTTYDTTKKRKFVRFKESLNSTGEPVERE